MLAWKRSALSELTGNFGKAIPTTVFFLLFALSGCATKTTWIADDPTCSGSDNATARQAWTNRAWRNPYYTLQIKENGERLSFVVDRVAHPSVRWGQKTAMRAEGSVRRVSACRIELEGIYAWSESAYQVGKTFRYHATRQGGDLLVGKMYGAAQEWRDMSFKRDE